MNPGPDPDDRRLELLADRALQGLDEADRAELDRLLAERPDDDRLDLAVAELSLGRGGYDPLPLGLAARVAEGAAAHFGDRPAIGPRARRPIVRRVLPWLGWAAAAGLLVLALARKPEGARSIREELAGAPSVALGATEHPLARGAGGSVAWDGRRQLGYLALDGLAPVDPGRGTYQVWIFDATRDERYPIDGGTFGVGPDGRTAIVPIRARIPARRPTLFAITLEPPGGVVVSDRKRVLLRASWPD